MKKKQKKQRIPIPGLKYFIEQEMFMQIISRTGPPDGSFLRAEWLAGFMAGKKYRTKKAKAKS